MGMPGSIAESAFGALGLPARRIADAVLYIVVMPKSSRSRLKFVQSGVGSRRKARLISSRIVYRGPVFWVTTDDVLEPGGVRARRDVVHHTGSVVVLAVNDSRPEPRLLLERQYRHAAKDYLWELPAGRIDPGERPLPAAKRELLEETGYTAAQWRRILNFYASPGFVAETMSVYLATGLRAGKAQPEDDEIIHKRLLPLSTALRMVLTGKIRDAKTIASVLWLDHQVTKRDLHSRQPRAKRTGGLRRG
jgi:ADP-ribose pyrophosphatase